MRIHGIKGVAPAKLEAQLAAGARFVFFEYCISLIVVTFRRPSGVYFMPPGKRGVLRGFPYALLSLLLGWWGVPWGLIYTPQVVLTNLSGGCDITADVRALLQQPADSPPL